MAGNEELSLNLLAREVIGQLAGLAAHPRSWSASFPTMRRVEDERRHTSCEVGKGLHGAAVQRKYTHARRRQMHPASTQAEGERPPGLGRPDGDHQDALRAVLLDLEQYARKNGPSRVQEKALMLPRDGKAVDCHALPPGV